MKMTKLNVSVDKAIAVVVLLLACLQGPLFYYYSFGIVTIIVFIPYILIGFIMTVVLLGRMIRAGDTSDPFIVASILFGFLVGTGSLFWGDGVIENIDWNVRFGMRNAIVQDVKSGKLQPNVPESGRLCYLGWFMIPPISNGGNTIDMERGKNGECTVEFLIQPGLLDHYSAFVYTDDSAKTADLDRWVQGKYVKPGNKKIREHWYRVSY
jgi:hypothetical protein